MTNASIITYQEDSLFKKMLKKIYNAFFKKKYILVIDESTLMLPEARTNEIVVKEKIQDFDANDAYTKIINNELEIEKLNPSQLFEVMNILNENLVKKSKKLTRKISFIENKVESMSL